MGRSDRTERPGSLPDAARGRSGRLARGAALGAVAGLAVAALLLLLAGCSGDDDVSAGTGGDGSGSPTTTRATPAEPATAAPTLAVTAAADAADRTVDVVVDDPALPAAPGATQCAHVRVVVDGAAAGPAAAEGTACRTPGGPVDPATSTDPDGAVRSALRVADGVEIGTSCAVERAADGPATAETVAASTTFRFELPPTLAAGDYRVEAVGGSGPAAVCLGVEGDPADGTAGTASATTTVRLG